MLLTVPKNIVTNSNPLLRSYLQKPQIVKFNPAKMQLIKDKLRRELKNDIVMVQDEGKCHYSFYDGENRIGYAVFADSGIKSATPGTMPSDWFSKIAVSGDTGKLQLKPYIFVDELVIEDRVGLTGEYSQRKSGKKYGTMCLQKILEWAKEQGFGSRLSLVPGKTYSDIAPHKFYAKIGFEMAPNDIEKMERIEAKYEKEPCHFARRKNEKVDGRWVSRGAEVFLTHPEILENYPLD